MQLDELQNARFADMNMRRTIPLDLQDWVHNFQVPVEIREVGLEYEAFCESMDKQQPSVLVESGSASSTVRAPVDNFVMFFAI